VLIEINPLHPEPRKIRRVIEALESGAVISYPTDAVYSLACDSVNRKAIDKLYQIKGMDREHPLSFNCPDLSEIAKYAIVDNSAYRILRRYLPGPYCFILEATREVPRVLQTKRKTVGIRVPAHPIIQAITRELGRPVLSTTAQRPDGEIHVDPHEIDAEFKGQATVIDGGVGGRVPTTIVDLTTQPPEVVREGLGSIDEFVEDAPKSLRDVREAMRSLQQHMRD